MQLKLPPKDKVIVVVFISLFGTLFVAAQLFVPLILVSIVAHDHPNYTTEESQAKASIYKSFADGTVAIVNLFILPLLGNLSDVYGRKKVMIFGAVVQFINVLCMYLAYSFNLLWMIYVGSVFGFVMVIQLCGIAYMGDIASDDEKEKTTNYGVAMAALMMGIIMGALLLGFIGGSSIDYAFYTMFAIGVIMIITITAVFTEDSKFYRERNQRKFSFTSVNPFNTVRALLGKSTFITLLVVIYAFNFMGMSDTMNTSVLYAKYRYHWSSAEIGISSALRGLSGVIWQGVGLGLMLKRISRQTILTYILLFSFVVYVFQGFAFEGWMFMLASAIGGYTSIAFPVIQALISEQLKGQQGMVLGGTSAIAAIATLIGSLMGGNVFAWCVESEGFTCPGTVYYISGIIYLLSAVFCYFIFRKYPPGTVLDSQTGKLEEEGKELLDTTGKEEEEIGDAEISEVVSQQAVEI